MLQVWGIAEDQRPDCEQDTGINIIPDGSRTNRNDMPGASNSGTELLMSNATGYPSRGGQAATVSEGPGKPKGKTGTAASPARRINPIVSGDTWTTGPPSTVPGVQFERTRFGEIGAEDAADKVTGAVAGFVTRKFLISVPGLSRHIRDTNGVRRDIPRAHRPIRQRIQINADRRRSERGRWSRSVVFMHPPRLTRLRPRFRSSKMR